MRVSGRGNKLTRAAGVKSRCGAPKPSRDRIALGNGLVVHITASSVLVIPCTMFLPHPWNPAQTFDFKWSGLI